MTFLPALALCPQSMLRNQRTSLQEIYSHERYLSRLNQELIKAILDNEDSVALNVREMLQQQSILGVRAVAAPRPASFSCRRALCWLLSTSALPATSERMQYLLSPAYQGFPMHWSLVEWVIVTLTPEGKL